MTNQLDIGHGMSLTFTKRSDETVPSDVWVNFKGEDGKSASFSIAAYAKKAAATGALIIAAGLRSWASDRINEFWAAKIAEEDAAREASDGGQFGMGA